MELLSEIFGPGPPLVARSRSPRRRRRQREAPVLQFGRHQGSTFEDVLRNDPGYCNWALRVQNPTGALRQFASWLRRRRGGHSRAGPSRPPPGFFWDDEDEEDDEESELEEDREEEDDDE